MVLKELHPLQEDLTLLLVEALERPRILELMLVMVLLEELILAMVHQELEALEDLLLVDILAEGEMLGTWNCLPLKTILYLKKS